MRKTATIFINTFRTLSLRKILRLLKLVIPHPLFSLLGFYATVKSFAIAKEYFPKTNSTNGVGNAFRHALWTCLIAMYCSKISSPRKAVHFCRRMTNLHEELFPNKPLETKMDLHNNAVGMRLYGELLQGTHRQFFETGFFVEHLLEKTKSAKLLQNLDDNFEGELVYISEI